MKPRFIYNQREFIERRKDLRNNRTEAEARLWYFLKGSQLGGHKFIRQYSAGPYILDFYCPKLRLAVELDGNQHNEKEAQLYDGDRTDYLKAINIKVIRFWNNELLTDTETVLNRILSEITPS